MTDDRAPDIAESLADRDRMADLLRRQPPGCWIAYYSDRSAVAVFGSELDALRHAVEHEMRVRFQPWGPVEFP